MRVFFNGSHVATQTPDTKEPILVTGSAQPGQKISSRRIPGSGAPGEKSTSSCALLSQTGTERSEVHLRLPGTASRAAETNLVEKEERQLTVGDGGREVVVSTHPYEIKAVKVWFETNLR